MKGMIVAVFEKKQQPQGIPDERYIRIVAKRVGANEDDVAIALAARGRNIGAIRKFLHENRGCGSYA